MLVAGVVAWMIWGRSDWRQRVVATIGPSGGTIEHPCGAKVCVPEGALRDETEVSIATADADKHQSPVGDLQSEVIALDMTPS